VHPQHVCVRRRHLQTQPGNLGTRYQIPSPDLSSPRRSNPDFADQTPLWSRRKGRPGRSRHGEAPTARAAIADLGASSIREPGILLKVLRLSLSGSSEPCRFFPLGYFGGTGSPSHLDAAIDWTRRWRRRYHDCRQLDSGVLHTLRWWTVFKLRNTAATYWRRRSLLPVAAKVNSPSFGSSRASRPSPHGPGIA
jgi:hypothetical protein